MAQSSIVKIPSTWFHLHHRMKANGKPMLHSEEHNFDIGFNSNLIFPNPAAKHFLCSICKGLPRYPYLLPKCGHVFCYECITNLQSTTQTNPTLPCPNCEISFDITEMVAIEMASDAQRNIYASFLVRCPYQCGYVSSPKAVIQHESWKCSKRPVKCTNLGCGLVLPDQEMEMHLEQCSHRYIFCDKCHLPKLVNNNAHECLTTESVSAKCIISYLFK